MGGHWEPNPNLATSLENFKKRCEMFATLGLTRIYSPTTTTQKFTPDDYKAGADNMREVGEIAKQFGMIAMAEAVRASTFISTLTTLLRMTREEIASLLGLKLETVSRLFSRLHVEGLIQVQGRSIKLLDSPALKAMVGQHV